MGLSVLPFINSYISLYFKFIYHTIKYIMYLTDLFCLSEIDFNCLIFYMNSGLFLTYEIWLKPTTIYGRVGVGRIIDNCTKVHYLFLWPGKPFKYYQQMAFISPESLNHKNKSYIWTDFYSNKGWLPTEFNRLKPASIFIK